MAACRSMHHDDTAPTPPAPCFETLGAAREAGVITPFRAWRGRSGRRYVVSVYRADDVPTHDGAVLIAVRRERDGARRILGVSVDGAEPPQGADEIHVHLLAHSAVARLAVLADLQNP
jgi:hypothetical protein